MITPTAPLFWALRILTVKSQVPRPSSAIFPVRSGSGGLSSQARFSPCGNPLAGSETTLSGAVTSLVSSANSPMTAS